MKKITPPTTGKILVHNAGAGAIGARDLAQRTDEIASIAGHPSPTANDRDEAERELRGNAIPPTGDVEGLGVGAVTRDPSEPPSNFGVEKPNYEADDEQKAAERLVLEGVEEAQHEQMVAARRQKKKE